MSTTFVRSRNRSRQLLYTAERPAEGTSPWLVAVGIGTAGCRRALLLLQRISELSELSRVQSAVFYDCNEITANYVAKFLRKFLGGAKAGSGIQVLLPNYIPLPDGFMRDPRRYEEYLGPLERDMDNIVSQLTAQSERCGRAPELIIEFMGFAGHAVLGGRLHQKLRVAFPSAVILPVMMLPRDHVSEEWTRRCIWEEYESLLGGCNCLVTTQSDGYAGEDDIRLATGLAGLEAADFEDEEGSSGSPLAATLRRLAPASGGWLGMAVVKRKVPVMRKFQWLRVPPWWREYAALGPEDELPTSLGHAIWSTLDPTAQMADGVNDPGDAPQAVVVSMPVHADVLEPVAKDAAEALERSSIFDRFPKLDIAFYTAWFTEGIQKEPYLHVTRIYPMRGELAAVSDILRPGALPGERPSAAAETGFGSYYHLRGYGAAPQLAAPGSAVDDFDADWRRNLRYF